MRCLTEESRRSKQLEAGKKSSRSTTRHAIATVALITSILICPFAQSQSLIRPQAHPSDRLRIEYWGSVDDYGCSPNEPARYSGGIYGLRLLILPEGMRPGDVPYNGITDWSWPAGLKIEVSKLTNPDAPFKTSPALYNRMHVEYYVTAIQVAIDSLWRAGSINKPSVVKGLEYHFAFRVPEELTGSYLCVRAEWDHPEYGHLVTERPCCIRIVAPCSDRARDKALGTHITVAADQRQYERATALADSLIALGFGDFWGLVDAIGAAKRLERYDDAIRYLDACFTANHTIAPSEERPSLTAPTEQTLREYQAVREQLSVLRDQIQQR